jgi:hypothetical protein
MSIIVNKPIQESVAIHKEKMGGQEKSKLDWIRSNIHVVAEALTTNTHTNKVIFSTHSPLSS